MGKHSSSRGWRFYTSVIRYFLPWALVAVAGVSAVWAGVGALGEDELDPAKGPLAESEEPRPSAQRSSTAPVEEEPTPAESPPGAGDERVELITENMTVQVLNGTGVAGAHDSMAQRLSGLGFAVVNVAPAAVSYAETTVLWSYAESEDAANRLAERFGWQVGPKPDNLSTEVALHVVVGADET